MYEALYPDISAFAARRLGSPHGVADAVAEVFTVAWRRFDKIPPPPQDRLWVFGVARRIVADQRRSSVRHGSLVRRLASQEQTVAPTHAAVEDPPHDQLRRAIESLRSVDREALLLVLWDGLSHAEAAEVLKCSVNAVGIRVHRAKRRLRDALIVSGYLSPESTSVPVTPKITRS
jgi:RNA polymerase sigma-70 factor (ECF subfamily)